MGRIILVRHGETEWNAANRVQGSTDTPLGAVGEDQAVTVAHVLGRNIAAEPPRVVASPLARARRTAEIVGDVLDVAVLVDDALTQRAYGVWEGMEHADIERKFPGAHRKWRAGEEPDIEGYESDDALAGRVVEALEQHAAAGEVIAVSHGSVIRVAIQAMVGLPLGRGGLGRLSNGEWSELVWHRGRWSLMRHAVPLRSA